MKKTIQLIPLCAALFWACSDSPDVTGTTIIDNTMSQNESSSSEIQGQESSSSTPQSSAQAKSSSSQQPPKLSSSSVTTSSASQPPSSSAGTQEASPAFAKDTKNGFKLGSCIASGLEPLPIRAVPIASLAEASSGEMPKAYILNDGEGHYQVMALNVRDYCLVEADLLTKRSGDTLQIDYGVVHSETTCTCYSDHWFDIEPENANVKFIQIMFFNRTTYQVSDGPAPEPSKTTPTDSTAAQNDSVLTDTRDGKTYKIVKLGEKIWMAENLNYEMDDGVKSWCNGNKKENCDKYGRLYTYKSATYACPTGWHLPEVEEWPERGNGGHPAFLNYAVVGWYGGKDTYGFSILPAGNYSAKSQYFFEPGGGTTYFWTMTIDTRNNNCATMIHFGSGSEGMVSVCASDENDGLSVRCLKD
ncbi:FISUMP domain-containing protein [Fibrobacter sp.]|uniref:FISUMP domain-containing protein n=1 Tax=Fibrobacter sp. TaxID=35828 RepID=UPI0025C292B3|nr:FISUMP domain-containing protein [Fibrobacter sp.]MBR3070835.1 hypothetical protein [Fibrobacter sp.]